MDKFIFEKPNPFGRCNKLQIDKFEKKSLIKIPEDYKDYLLKFNGSNPVNTICSLNDNDGTTVHHMYGLHNCKEFKIKLEKNMLIFADDSFGNKFAINIDDGENYGCIYFIDEELIDTEYASESIMMINKSFTEFISSLISDDVYSNNLEKENPEIYARIQEFKKNPQI